MQAVVAFGQRLAFHGDGVAEFDGRVFVGSGAPHFSVGLNAADHLASFDQRAVVANGDVGDSDPLRNLRALAGARQVQQGRLGLGHRDEDEYCGQGACCKQGICAHKENLLEGIETRISRPVNC